MDASAPPSDRDLWYWLAGYLILVAAVIGGLALARNHVVASSDQAEQADWDQWRADAGQSGGPVARTVPKSAEPPIRVLLRDHFGGVVLGSLLPTSALYVFIAWSVRGMLRQWRRPIG